MPYKNLPEKQREEKAEKEKKEECGNLPAAPQL